MQVPDAVWAPLGCSPFVYVSPQDILRPIMGSPYIRLLSPWDAPSVCLCLLLCGHQARHTRALPACYYCPVGTGWAT